MPSPINAIIDVIEKHYNADIYLLSDYIEDRIANLFQLWTRDNKIKRHKNALLLLCTYGGSADAAYKIARSIQTAYECVPSDDDVLPPGGKGVEGKFYLFVNGPCKSAGTLIATGADIFLLSDSAEFGPIDVQVRKPDEAGERTSGLATVEAFDPLRKEALKTFCAVFNHLRYDADFGLSSKMAADIANKLTVGLFGPVYAQIDPIRVAELNRMLRIGAGYAERLSHGNLHDGAIGMLLAGYPSHGFVIDKEEAKRIFKNLEEPIDALKFLGDLFCKDDAERCFPMTILPEAEAKEEGHVGKTDEGNCEGSGGSGQEISEDYEPGE